MVMFFAPGVPDDMEIKKQAESVTQKPSIIRKRVKHKKREIRVFVSSTFRDFTNEREEIIKKAFREVSFGQFYKVELMK